jgi:hypothetical protein
LKINTKSTLMKKIAFILLIGCISLFSYGQLNEISFNSKTEGYDFLKQLGENTFVHLLEDPSSKKSSFRMFINLYDLDLKQKDRIEVNNFLHPSKSFRILDFVNSNSSTAYFVQILNINYQNGGNIVLFNANGELKEGFVQEVDFLEGYIGYAVTADCLHVFSTKNGLQNDESKWFTEKMIMHTIEGDDFKYSQKVLSFPSYRKRSNKTVLGGSTFWDLLYYRDDIFCFYSVTTDLKSNSLFVDLAMFNEKGERIDVITLELKLKESFLRYSYSEQSNLLSYGLKRDFFIKDKIYPLSDAFVGISYDYYTGDYYLYGLTGEKNLEEYYSRKLKGENPEYYNTGFYVAKFNQKGNSVWLAENKVGEEIAKEYGFKRTFDSENLKFLYFKKMNGKNYLEIYLPINRSLGLNLEYHYELSDEGHITKEFTIPKNIIENPLVLRDKEFDDFTDNFTESQLKYKFEVKEYFEERCILEWDFEEKNIVHRVSLKYK